MILELKAFEEALQNELFFEAHEILEEYWHRLKKLNHPNQNIIKGFINLAVSCELLRRGRQEAAQRVYQTYKKYCFGISPKSLYFQEFTTLNGVIATKIAELSTRYRVALS